MFSAVALYWFSTFILFMLALLMVIGIIWSPFGAVIAYIIARKRENSPIRHAVIGILCSALFLLPWLVLVVPLRLRRFTVASILICAYIAWLLGPLLLSCIILVQDSPRGGGSLSVGVVVMCATLISTLIWVIRSHTKFPHQCGLLPAYRVLVPSAGLFFSLVPFSLIAFI